MGTTRNFDAFMEQARRNGDDPYYAAMSDGAREAHDLDQQADVAVNKAKTVEAWLQVDKQGNPTVQFTSQEHITAAMRDPLYKTSPAYRAAVENCIARMAPTPAPNIERGVAKGFTVESMEKEARHDAARATYRELVVKASHDPNARLQLIQLLQSPDPAVQDWIAEGTSAIGNEGPGQRMMREAGSGSFGPDLNKAMVSEEEQNNSNGPASEEEAGEVKAS